MRSRIDWGTFPWFLFSILVLVALLVYFWIVQPSHLVLFFPPQEVSIPINKDRIDIQIEKAEISRVSETGKEWDFRTRDLQKGEKDFFLNGVDGIFYHDNSPLYRVEAQKGQVQVETTDALLSDVTMLAVKGDGQLTGDTLRWMGNENSLRMEKVHLKKKDLEISCGYIVYNLKDRRMFLEENVIIKIKVKEKK
ncbi:MAG: LPS export ABC transporter periplasmic protein LptC [Candidatus Atribacteria bacterium]|nr:LPS export ABC transporter periplasmic protein LptC [Candidatus Atribacteria bacterium]